jgi:5-(carboxyamino)imidazole ribonucleotide synthase
VLLEFEHVNVDALEALEKEGKPVFPSASVLRMIQDKGLQKMKLQALGVPTADFYLVRNRAELKALNPALPCVQKSRTMGYDGQGVKVLKTSADLEDAFDGPSVIEPFVPFEKEIAVILARSADGEMAVYPVVEMHFDSRRNILQTLNAPAHLPEVTAEKARQLAKKLAEALDYVGVMAVELFVLPDGQVLVNEMAPRVHNSGHHTIEANVTSQYEQSLRCVLGLPLGSVETLHPAVMVNLYGEEGHTGTPIYSGLEDVLKKDGIFVHLYGKLETRPFRKMGHVTLLGDTPEEVQEKAQFVLQTLKVIS